MRGWSTGAEFWEQHRRRLQVPSSAPAPGYLGCSGGNGAARAVPHPLGSALCPPVPNVPSPVTRGAEWPQTGNLNWEVWKHLQGCLDTPDPTTCEKHTKKKGFEVFLVPQRQFLHWFISDLNDEGLQNYFPYILNQINEIFIMPLLEEK